MIVSQIKSTKTALELLNRCGPLTLIQLAKLSKNTNPHRLSKFLVENGYAGLMPTYPVKLVATGLPFDAPEITTAMADVLGALERLGSASSPEIAKEIGRTRETVDSFLRQAKDMDLCHISGDRQSDLATNMRVYVWTYGPGENFVREKRAAGRPKKDKSPTTTVMTGARRDPFIEAMFGRAA